MNLELRITKGQRTGYLKQITKPERVLIGRDASCDLSIPDDPLLSRQHCLIEITNSGIKAIDLKSRNGTFVSGQRIGEKILGLHDEIRVGSHVFQIVPQQNLSPGIVGKCGQCACNILDRDVKERRAFRHGDQIYCQQCLERGIPAKNQRRAHQATITEEMSSRPPMGGGNPPAPNVQKVSLPPGIPTQIGPFQVLDVLGEGGMGFVFKARHTYLENVVAIKVIKEEFTSEEKIVKRFLQEAKLGISLDHPNILRIHDAGEANGNFYISMECFDGEDVNKIIKKHGPLVPPILIKLAVQMASGLGHAHQKGIIHRDVKPSNILVDRKGVVKIADFGLAKVREKAGQLTASGQMLGTIQYISPEQLEDAKSVNAQTDIFSLGGTLYYTLTGYPPFGEDPPGKVIENILRNDPPPLRGAVANISAELENIIMKALAKKSKDRFQTMEEMRDALLAIKT
ncbi:protein kinase [Candidatus Uabimicrobium sp. HlEnr_7]|uniref:protein kinase domain-containing protein n=1 Tax=Candidatus Uabimicrobium helgolandensis TaxID=3095367 RepID=UPI0035564F0C